MKKWHKVALGAGVVVGGVAVLWLVTDDPEGRAMREKAVAKLAGDNEHHRPMMRAIGRNGTTLELSTKGTATCHEEEKAKTMKALGETPGENEGVTALTDSARVYVVTPQGDLGTAARDEIPSLRGRGFSLATREMVAEQKATLHCGDPSVKCSERWLEEMASTYSTGEVGKLMAALRFNEIACVGDEWQGSRPLKY